MLLKEQTESTTFTSFTGVVAAYKDDLLTPQMAEKMVEVLVRLTTSIRQEFRGDEEWQRISDVAYPQPTMLNGQNKLPEKAQKPRRNMVVLMDQSNNEHDDDARSTGLGAKAENP